jgi:hypothetical protein
LVNVNEKISYGIFKKSVKNFIYYVLENHQCTQAQDTSLFFISWKKIGFTLNIYKNISGTPTNDLCSVYTKVIEISRISSETLLDSSETNGT